MRFRFSFPNSLHTINQKQLPRDLRETRNWFVLPIGGDRTQPITHQGEHHWADTSQYLSTFEDACSMAEEMNQRDSILSGEFLSLEYLLTPDCPYVGIKVHSCSNIDYADKLFRRFEYVYAESISCFMNQAIVKAEIPNIAGEWFSVNDTNDVAVTLCNNDFMTITSDTIRATSTLEGVQLEMDELMGELTSGEMRSRPATAFW